MKALLLTVSSFALTSLSHCFFLLSAFLCSKPFWNNKVHCKIIDSHFNVFTLQCCNTTEKRNLENCFFGARVWVPEPVNQSPKQPTYDTGETPPPLIYRGRVQGFGKICSSNAFYSATPSFTMFVFLLTCFDNLIIDIVVI